MQGRTLISGFVVGAVASGLALTAIGTPANQSPRAADRAVSHPGRGSFALASSLSFEPNAGRLPRSLDYLARVGRSQVGVGPSRVVLAVPGAKVDTRLVGARDVRAQATGRLPGVVNDFTTRDARAIGMHTYRTVRYRSVYPGVDVVYHGRAATFEYDFALAPGADPGRIRLAVGATDSRPRLAPNGDLLIPAGQGTVRQRRPVAWQGASRVPVRFVVDGRVVSLDVGRYDRSRPLLIDPRVEFGDYVGGSAFDELQDVALDGSGNVLVVGDMRSAAIPGFTGTKLPSTNNDVVVAKFSPSGGRIWLSYVGDLGTSSFFSHMHLALDAGGNPVIAGDLTVSGPAMPTVNADDSTAGPSSTREGWLGRLNGSNGSLVYLTYFGGSSYDYLTGLAVDGDGNAYVGGSTNSTEQLAMGGAYDTTRSNYDAYLAKFSPLGTRSYTTYIGGSGSDGVDAVAVKPGCSSSCEVFLVGDGDSTDFPLVAADLSTPKPLFAMKFNSPLSAPLWSTYYTEETGSDPGTYDVIRGMTVDVAGDPTVAGETTGSASNQQVFVHTFYGSSGTKKYDLRFGGSGIENVKGVAVDPQKNIYVAGNTNSDPDSNNFPMTAAPQSTRAGVYDVFAAKIDPTAGFGLGPFVFLTYLGGGAGDAGWGIAPDGAGGTWVVGGTSSSDFPVVNPTQPYGTNGDGYITKLQTAPVSIDSGPSGKVTSSSADFKFHSDELNRSYFCRLSPVEASFTPCSGVTGTSYTGLADGAYKFEVQIKDAGDTPGGSASRDFTVELKPNAALTAAPNPALVGRSVEFDASTSTAPNGVAKYEWDLDGDGTFERDTGTEPKTSQVYFVAGTVPISVRLTDKAGVRSTASVELRINQGTGVISQFGVTVNKGAQFTRSVNVSVNVNFPPNTSSFLFSNDGGFLAPAVFVPKTEIPWKLDSSGPERLPKTIYVRFLIGALTSQTYQDDIILDEIPPTVQQASVAPAAGAASIATLRKWKIKIRAKDSNSGVGFIQVAVKKKRPGKLIKYRTKVTVNLGRRPEFVRARDRAGNYSRWRALR